MSCLLLPFTSAMSLLSAGCCAINTCCTLASCFGCKANSAGAKALYIGIFFVCAVLAIVLRYWGQDALSSWVSVINVCNDGACWGQQADYRISGALFGFYVLMAIATAVYRVCPAYSLHAMYSSLRQARQTPVCR